MGRITGSPAALRGVGRLQHVLHVLGFGLLVLLVVDGLGFQHGKEHLVAPILRLLGVLQWVEPDRVLGDAG